MREQEYILAEGEEKRSLWITKLRKNTRSFHQKHQPDGRLS